MAATIASIISSCPAPVSDASGMATGRAWLALADVFAINAKQAELPNKNDIAAYSESFFIKSEVKTTYTADEYALMNNNLMHIKDMYTATQSLFQ